MTWSDWAVVGLYVLGSLAIGLFYRRHASRNIEEYFIKMFFWGPGRIWTM